MDVKVGRVFRQLVASGYRTRVRGKEQVGLVGLWIRRTRLRLPPAVRLQWFRIRNESELLALFQEL